MTPFFRPFHGMANMRQILRARAVRRGFLALGLALLIAAQVYFETREPLGKADLRAAVWNAVYNLQLPNYENVWRALPLLLGGALLWLFFGSLSWEALPPAPTDERRTPFFTRGVVAQLFAAAVLYAFLLFRLARLNKTALEPLLWLLVLGWLTLLLWRREKDQARLFGLRAEDLVPLFILLIVGIGIGSFALTDVPKQIIRDELPFWEASRLIALGGYDASIFEVGVFTFPLSTSIYQSWVLRLFGANLWAWKFSSALAGVAAVVPLYLLAREWFNPRVAFAAGLLMLCSPYFLAFSRFGYNNIHALFPVTLSVYWWQRGLRAESPFFLWLGGLAAGLGYYSYFAAWLAPVLAGTSVFFLLAVRRLSWKRAGLPLAVLTAAFCLTAAPRMVFLFASGRSEAFALKVFQASLMNAFYGRYFYTDSDLTRFYPFIEIAGLNEPIFFNPQIYWELLARGFIRNFLAFWNPYLSAEHFLPSGLAGAAPIFFSVGLTLALKRGRDLRAGLLLLWFFGGTLLLGVLDSFPPRHTHLVALIPALALFNALGLSAAAETFFSAPAWRRLSFAVALAALILLNLHSFFVLQPLRYPADFETQAAWVARRNEVRVPVLYAGSPDNLTGALIRANILAAPYLAFPAEEAPRAARQHAATPALIFLEGADEAAAQKIIRAGYCAAAYNGGYAFANADVNLAPRDDFFAEARLFLKSPAPLALGVLLLALGALYAVFR